MSKQQKNQNRNISIRIGGEAGQGMNVISGLLGKVFLRSGFWVFTHHDIMSRIRGGHNFSQIRFSTSPIQASSSQVKILVCLDKNTLNLYKNETEGFIIFDPDQLAEKKLSGEKYLPVALEKIAKEKPAGLVILDVRDSGAPGTIPGAVNIPLDQLAGSLGDLSKDNEYIIHCNTGIMAGMALKTLTDNGYKARYLDAVVQVSPDGTFEITEK